jgi:hypothetical protein
VLLSLALPAVTWGASFFPIDEVERLAPVVVFHQDERYHPTSGKEFLDHAGLAFGHDGCRPKYWHYRVQNGKENPWSDAEIAALGSGGFVERVWSSKCKPLSDPADRFSTADLTRPRTPHRSRQLRSGDGWYLDLADDDRAGMPDEKSGDSAYETQAPTYYDDGLLYEKGHPNGDAFITYWFFYDYDNGPLTQNHEGDWEDVSIRLQRNGDGWQPVNVFYAKHGKESDVLSWGHAFKAKVAGAIHPKVFSAKGTHASYGGGVSPRHYLDRIDEHGPTWNTWTGLRYLWDQGWVGYCGAWGRIGRISDTTGPLGPGCLLGDRPAKSGRPKSWGSSIADRPRTHTDLPIVAPPPTSDSDGDGIPDASDSCPQAAGIRADGCPNPPPSAGDAEFTMAVNGGPGKTTYLEHLTATDDTGVIAGWSLDYQSFGTASQNFHWGGDGSFTMKPEAQAGATLTFRYHVIDGEGAVSNQATVTIHVCQNGTAHPCPP